MDLQQGDEIHFAGAQRSKKTLSIGFNCRTRVPICKAKVEYTFVAELAHATFASGKNVDNPFRPL
jgi:hypothetical protein